MPNTTPIYGLPFLEMADPPNIPQDGQDSMLAVEAALLADAAALAGHIEDATDAHDASAISFTPVGEIAATDVQAAIAELVNTTRAWVAKTNTTDQSGISAVTDITGLSVTWTADPARIYKTTLNVGFSKATTANFVALHLTDGSNNIQVSRSSWMQIADYTVVELTWTETGLSGSQTRKARCDATSGTVSVVNSFNRNGILIVEDIGPA